MRIGILTSGGDCPGINATIRGVCKTAINHYGMEVIGIHSGFQGLLTKDIESFTDKSLSGLLNQGGTMLGTSREKPFKKGGVVSDVDKPALILQNIQEMGLDCVVCIGGNGTQKTAAKFAAMGVNIVSVPKTIDNDIWGTDISFGFDSAVSIATDAIDRLHSTASSHKRVMVIEVMGHKAGWIALYSGMAGRHSCPRNPLQHQEYRKYNPRKAEKRQTLFHRSGGRRHPDGWPETCRGIHRTGNRI